MAIDVDLGAELQAVMDELLAAGRYATAHELICDGVRMVQARAARLVALEAAIDQGIADFEAGRLDISL
jgi:antitoxin ParD1/3/4